MTLVDIINHIENVAWSQPNVKTIIRNDIYKLNNLPDAQYPVVGWTQNAHRVDNKNGIITYRLNLYYIDRMTDTADNEAGIISFGIQLLEGIIDNLNGLDGVYIDNYDIQPFYQTFVDECAGVYAILNIDVPTDGCLSDYLSINVETALTDLIGEE